MKRSVLRFSGLLTISNLSIRSLWISPSSVGIGTISRFASSNSNAAAPLGNSGRGDDEEFPTIDVVKSKMSRMTRRKRRERKEVPPPRYLKMPVDQDWPNVWPTARTFHPASVPLPLHQGYVPPQRASPNKFGNLELMKIPNFLHLTPPAIKRHCEALKKFCTPWPEELKDKEVLEGLFPIEITTNDYCHSSPVIRDIRSRIVTLQIKLSSLNLDAHARDKFFRLVGDRYDKKSDIVTITAEYCPLKKQNYDYAMYLLTALYHESWTTEKWESEKEEADMEHYIWDGSKSQKAVDQILGLTQGEGELTLTPVVEQYRDAVTTLHNKGEDLSTVGEYGKSVRELFNLPLPIT